MREITLPALGADMDQGKLIEWKVQPGDHVKRGDVIAVVDTSKAAIDIECWEDGTVYELYLTPDQTVPVGTVIATLLDAGETPEQARAARTAAHAAAPLVQTAAGPGPILAAPASPKRGPIRSSPAARKHALALDVDLGTVTGTGPHGAITLDDVNKAASAKPAPPDRTRDMRRTIAAAMARSKREIPHYYLATDIPLAHATAWLTTANEQRPVTERLLMAALLLKATALAAAKFPEVNGFYKEDRFLPSRDVHLGVAIALRQGGLIAPAIHATDQKTLTVIMQEVSDLVRRARAGSLRSSELSDPTITVSNLGEQGVETLFGVIYPPQVALVGFGRIAQKPHVIDDQVRAVPVVSATLSADHRVSDGHRGALFLAAIKNLLQLPELL
jgi:pyruvate dehydrogenase E2 component (dihydrolipoamide acetyltransferase)